LLQLLPSYCYILGFNTVGGYSALKVKYMEAYPVKRNMNTTCGLPREDAFHIFLDATGAENPWPGLILQSSFGCLWYWCCDQVSSNKIQSNLAL
jgi:hypothetical protein